MPAPETWSPSKEGGRPKSPLTNPVTNPVTNPKEGGRPKSPLNAGFVTGFGSPTASLEATAGIAAAGADAAAGRRSGVFTDSQVQRR